MASHLLHHQDSHSLGSQQTPAGVGVGIGAGGELGDVLSKLQDAFNETSPLLHHHHPSLPSSTTTTTYTTVTKQSSHGRHRMEQLLEKYVNKGNPFLSSCISFFCLLHFTPSPPLIVS